MQPSYPPDQHRSILNERTPGTVAWLFQESRFQSWLHGDYGLLWCIGQLGAGKTVLASAVTQYLVDDACLALKARVAYLYCGRMTSELATPGLLLYKIWQQLREQRVSVWGDLKPSQTSIPTRHHAPAHPVWNAEELLQAELNQDPCRKTFIVIDSVEELDHVSREVLMRMLDKYRTLSCFVTSRSAPAEPTSYGEQYLLVAATDRDLTIHIDHQLRATGTLVALAAGSSDVALELRTKIVSTIRSASDNSFLLCRLQLDYLASATSLGMLGDSIDAVLRSAASENILWATLGNAIARIQDLPAIDRALALQAICCVSCAARPMTVDELLCATSIQDGRSDENHSRLSTPEDLRQVSVGLLVIDPETSHVHFTHPIVARYLEEKMHAASPLSHLNLSLKCLSYLSHFDPTLEPLTEQEDAGGLVSMRPFLSYAARHLGDHLKHVIFPFAGTSSKEERLRSLLVSFLGSERSVKRAALIILHHLEAEGTYPVTTKCLQKCSATNLAAFYDLLSIDEVSRSHKRGPLLVVRFTRMLLGMPSHTTSELAFGNAFHWAAAAGAARSVEAAAQLHNASAVINEYNVCGQLPVHIAVRCSNTAMVAALLEAGATITKPACGRCKGSILHLALERPNSMALIPYILQLDDGKSLLYATDANMSVPLTTAILCGHREAVSLILSTLYRHRGRGCWQTLLDQRALCNWQGHSPFHASIQNLEYYHVQHDPVWNGDGDVTILQDLLSREGIDEALDVPDYRGDAVLAFAVRQDNLRAMDLLHRHGSWSSPQLKGAFRLALRVGSIAAVIKMLDMVSTSPQTPEELSRSPEFDLKLAKHPHLHEIHLHIETTEKSDGGSELTHSTRNITVATTGCESIAGEYHSDGIHKAPLKLRDFVPNDDKMGIKLRDAVEESCFETLSERPVANILHNAILNADHRVLSLCMEQIPEMKMWLNNYEGEAPSGLHVACIVGNVHAVKQFILLDPAMVNRQDHRGLYPLLAAAKRDYDEICCLLIGAGADINAQSADGRSALEEALLARATRAASCLIENGAIIPSDLDANTSMWLSQQRGSRRLLGFEPAQASDLFTVALLLRRMLDLPRRPGISARRLTDYAGLTPSKSADKHPMYHPQSTSALTMRIIDLAQYWMRSTDHRKVRSVCMFADRPTPYLLCRPIMGRGVSPVKRIRMRIKSRDQGWVSDSASPSWSRFRLYRDHSLGPVVASNTVADRSFRVHTVDLLASDAENQWMKGLRPDDIIGLVPTAEQPGWENRVAEASIDVYTTCIRS